MDATVGPNSSYIERKTFLIAMYKLYRGWVESYDSSNSTYSFRLGAISAENVEIVNTSGGPHSGALYLLGFN